MSCKMTSAKSHDRISNFWSFREFNRQKSESDICLFVKEFKDRIDKQLRCEEKPERTFISFADGGLKTDDLEWINNDKKRFFDNTPNESHVKLHLLSEQGFINCMIYTPDGNFTIVGHNSGLIQEFSRNTRRTSILTKYYDQKPNSLWYPMFYRGTVDEGKKYSWIKENHNKYLKGTPNKIVYQRWFFAEAGYITAIVFSRKGSHVIVGHSTGLIQMRHGHTGVVLCTLRNIQFPPKPVYSLSYSRTEENVCYASCMDGAIYRIEIPRIHLSDEVPTRCIMADPALEYLNLQFYGTPGISSHSTPFITQRSPALSMGITADQSKMVAGYGDTSIKIYDMETQQTEITFKVHKLRLQFIPKKLKRMHFGQVCALRCHDQKPNIFASAAWDKTLRIWDVRCKVGCVMTFEGVDICSDSIDLNENVFLPVHKDISLRPILCVAFFWDNQPLPIRAILVPQRDHCLAGSWQPTEALSVWDLVARKRLNIIRIQNRRPDVDGEYIYACRYWRSSQFNRKGKYGIIGGSGTNCVEVINLHNRYISCSYPVSGTVLALASHEERIAFGGTAPVFNIVTFHDPKHEKYDSPDDDEYDVMKSVTLLPENTSDLS